MSTRCCGQRSQKEKRAEPGLCSASEPLVLNGAELHPSRPLEMYLGVECKKNLEGECCIRKDQGELSILQ